MNAFVIDAFDFSRLKQRREGEVAVADLPRLAEESVDRTGTLSWSLEGGVDRLGHSQLVLSISGTVRLMCQRCLTPFAFDMASESTLVLAKDESSADEIDALLADDSIDVIVGSSAFDIAGLIEDEALLTVPLSPKHEACPDPLMSDLSGGAEKASPFAVLKNMKQ